MRLRYFKNKPPVRIYRAAHCVIFFDRRKDFRKEHFLRRIILNYETFVGDGFFISLGTLYKWNLDEIKK